VTPRRISERSSPGPLSRGLKRMRTGSVIHGPLEGPTETATVDVQQMSDRLKIAALLYGHAHAVNINDWGYRACSS